MAIQVFKVNDCEWWAGACTPEELLAAYMRETGCSHEDATGDVDALPVPLTEEQLDTLKFVHDENGDDLPVPQSFREHLNEMISKGEEFPCFFASTEW